MVEELDEVQIVCPGCGITFPVPRAAFRRAEPRKAQLRKARMAWSNKTGRFHRVMMTDPEYGQYRRKGSID